MARVEPVTSISIARFEEREKPSHHIVYEITVKGSSDTWTVWKRYSDFDALHKSLLGFFPNAKIPRPLPPKGGVLSMLGTLSASSRMSKGMGPEQLQERKEGLEQYLQGILYAKDTRLRHSAIFQDFLQVPEARRNSHAIAETSKDSLLTTLQASVARMTSGTKNTPAKNSSVPTKPDVIHVGSIEASTITSENWLAELDTIQQVLQQIRTAIKGREACAEKNDVTGLQSLNVQIRKAISAVTARIDKLEKSLSAMNMTPGEKSRRMNLVFGAKQELDSINEAISVPVSRGPRVTEESQTRKDLFGKSVQSAQNEGSSMGTGSSSRSNRKFGKSNGPPVETEETRPLDNKGLLQLQNRTMNHQDEALDALSAIIRRQKEIGLTMNHELDLQNQLLTELDTDVTRVEDNLKIADKKLGRILK